MPESVVGRCCTAVESGSGAVAVVNKVDGVDFEVVQENSSSGRRECGAPPVLLMRMNHTGLGTS